MKFLLSALLAVCLLATTAAAQTATNAPVFHSSWSSASASAATDQSLVLLIFSAEWCGPCKLLKNKTLASPEFLRQEAALQVAEVDIDADQKMARDFAVEAVPTLVLLTADGKILMRQTGFMEPAELLAWLATGRARAAAGQWEGTAPGAQFDQLIKQAAAADLGTNEIQRLVELLGDADPGNREQAGKLLFSQREKAVPPLIEAVGNAYLGERIAAGELLQRLAPGLTPVDPWQSPAAMTKAVAALQTWWAGTGKLPEAAPPPTNALPANALKEALDQLRGDDPVRSTAAMTVLVQAGAGALPAVREAIKRAEHSGNQRALGLLEDVFWTILVPDAVETQSGGVRRLLARGKSSERQAATERLGGIGRNALGVLVELAGDSDPLVAECAIRALAGFSGGDSVAALTTLLNSPDSNLRMTAAQALGHTKNATALKPLLSAARDPDEVVACTALSALEENQARDSNSRGTRSLPAEITEELKRCLSDPRWRVRAAAAEAAGKLGAGALDQDLEKLLGDSDGFVVKTALTALAALGNRPDSAKLVALSKRLPSLQADTVEMILHSENDETAKTVTALFNSGSTDARIAILGAFLRRGYYANTAMDEKWKPMLTAAIAAPDVRLRHTAAEVLDRRSPALAAQFVRSLLVDEDVETRELGCRMLLRILAEAGGNSSGNEISSTTSFNPFGGSKPDPSIASPAQLAAWHTELLQRGGAAPDLTQAAALFATGNGQADLPALLAALATTNRAAGSDRLSQESSQLAIQAVLLKLSLPAGRPVLEKLLASPVWFAQAARQAKRCRAEVAEFLLEPARFRAAVEPAAGSELSAALELLAGYEYQYDGNQEWSLWSETIRAKAVAKALLDSTNAAWRAAAVFALGEHKDAWQDPAVFDRAAKDINPWVRASAARALAQSLKGRTVREQRLGIMLADTDLPVASVAAVALLESETREAAGLAQKLNQFQFESSYGGPSQSTSLNDDRPLTVLEGTPDFLPAARKWLAAATGPESSCFALLLAQYGDFSGVDRLVTQLPALDAERDPSELYPLLAGIALSHDTKYLPALKQTAAAQHNDWVLRKLLQAMKGMSGPDVRQLRLDINKQLRNLGDASASPE